MKIHELLDEQTVGQVAGNLGRAFGTGKSAGAATVTPSGQPAPANLFGQVKKFVGNIPVPNIGGNRTEEQELRKQKDAALRAAREEAKKREAEINTTYNQAIADSRKNPSPTPESYIREHSTEIPDNLDIILRNLIDRADKQGLPSKLNYLALSELLEPLIGDMQLNKDNFTTLVNEYPNLKNYFEITDTGVTLQTDAKFKPKQKSQTIPKPALDDKNTEVEGMAKRGAKYLAKSRNNP